MAHNPPADRVPPLPGAPSADEQRVREIEAALARMGPADLLALPDLIPAYGRSFPADLLFLLRERARLVAELATAKAAARETTQLYIEAATCGSGHARIAELEAALLAAREDAARYQFLRDNWPHVTLGWLDVETGTRLEGGESLPVYTRTPSVEWRDAEQSWEGDTVDAAVDAARQCAARRAGAAGETK